MYFFFLLFCHTNKAVAQNFNADSTYLSIKTQKNDTLKINLLIDYVSKLIKNGSYKSGALIAKEGLSVAERIDNKNGEAAFNFLLGNAQRQSSDFKGALVFYSKASEIYKHVQNNDKLSLCYSNLGICYKELGDYPKAVHFHLESLKIAESIKSNDAIGRAYHNLGVCYKLQNEFTKALDYYTLAEKYYGLAKSNKSLLDILNNKISIYNKLLLLDSALTASEQLLKLVSPETNMRQYLNALGSLAQAHKHNGVYALEKIDPTKADFHFAKALKYYKQAINLESPESLVPKAKMQINLGLLYLAMKEYEASRSEIEDGIRILKEKGSMAYLKSAYLCLSDLDSAMSIDKNFTADNRLIHAKQALLNYKTAMLYKDSVSNEETTIQIEELKTQYETEKKDNQIALQKLSLKDKESALLLAQLKADKNHSEIELLNKTNDLQQVKLSNTQQELLTQQLSLKANEAQLQLQLKDKTIKDQQLNQEKIYRYGIIAISLVALFAGLLFFNRFKLSKQIEQQQKLIDQRKHISADLHDDVGSTLSSISIYSEAIKNKLTHNEPEKVMELVHKIGDNARDTISNLSDIVWSINPANDKGEVLFNRMETFATSMLSSKDILLKFNCEPSLHKQEFGIETKQNLFLIFKETINNIAKHSGASQVNILFNNSNNAIKMHITDNGKGFDTTNLNKNGHGGNGLKNMKERAAALKGTIAITSTANGTVTELKFSIG